MIVNKTKQSATTGKREFAVRFERTAKVIKRTAKPLLCVFLENAR
jgi:hypothetical protein